MLRLITLTLVMFGTLNAAYAQQYQDVVYLEDGSIIRGTIIETIPNHTIKIQTLDNSVFVCKISEIERITKEPVRNLFNPKQTPNKTLPSYATVPSEKSPLIAGACSFLVLGAGQVYNEDYDKALGHWLILIGSVVLIVQNEYSNNEDLRDLGATIAVANWIWSIVEAGVSAHKTNEENKQKFRQPPAALEFSKNIRANPILSRKQVGATLTFRW